jgi:acetyl-CoA C-acetyltransferase
MALMGLDPRTPVLVGGGQWSNRVDRGEPVVEPVELLAEAARRAAADTGAADPGKVLAAIDSVRVVSMLSWRYRDPGRLVAERLGLGGVRHTLYSNAGGNTPQSLVNRSALDIAAGALDIVLIGGAEAWRTRMAVRSAGGHLDWTVQDDDVSPDERFGGEFAVDDMVHPLEMARGIVMPVQVYPVFECALRAAAGVGHDEWAAHLGRLWSGFSEVAAANPHAWVQEAYGPEEVGAVSADNRMIGWPYPKRLNSNNAVEQGAAVLLCSVEAAERLGVPRDRWVFPHAGTDGHDTAHVSARRDLRSSPAIRVAGRRALDLAGADADAIAHADFYSCFPSAVQIGAAEIGFGLDRQLTVTGGLSFAGGPWNDYVTHSIATMIGVLRADPGSLGLITANGGFVTKHAFGVYGTEPPADGFRWEMPQDEIDASFTPTPVGSESDLGPVTVEAATVMHDRDGTPELAIAAVRTADGARTWATSRSPDVHEAFLTTEPVGLDATLTEDATLHL